MTIGINVTHIPYRGGAPAMQDLMAGLIDYQCASSATAIPQIESKTVKDIAVLTENRSALLPALASAHEQGLTIRIPRLASKPSGRRAQCSKVTSRSTKSHTVIRSSGMPASYWQRAQATPKRLICSPGPQRDFIAS
jgi:tripartite-type tricarboxylate transporter receptor subunit TctC